MLVPAELSTRLEPAATIYPPDPPGTVPAAVLVPLRLHPRGWKVLVTKRTDAVTTHKGQISFPGGVHDRGTDPTFLATALRETREEIGVPAGEIHILGRLAPYVTITNFCIHPFVGQLLGGEDYLPNPAEVERILEFELAPLAEGRGYSSLSVEVEGHPYHSHVYSVAEDLVIWGATAHLLHQLLRLFSAGATE
ncbi:MAG: hypothetical protein A2284_17535 [Deltaproteobacteria bacterium RIFOXYA12_FULL_61_11]|nr:MAG: hypothetical protein A2284_17535 [Deltaproteobacteria bacterium RIFOXYA12_FULL_61_11]